MRKETMFEEEYKNKNEFVKMLSEAISKHIGNIAKIDYELYESKQNPNWKTEFIVVHYRGGATQPRCVSGNSHGANLEEISKMLYSSQVFNDRDYYNRIVERSNRVNLEVNE
jgi:hypothetical protein